MSFTAVDAATAVSLLPFVSAVRVSSVLNGAVSEYGKAHLLDGSPDTCWNSEQGSPQSVQLSFDRTVAVCALELTFQGGFVGQVNHCHAALLFALGAVRVTQALSLSCASTTPALLPAACNSSAIVRSLTCCWPPLCCAQPMEVSVVRSGSRRFVPYAVYDTADHNAPQLFSFHKPLPSPPTAAAAGTADAGGAGVEVVALKLHFPASTDLFGRVTIYNLQVMGEEVAVAVAAD